MMPELIIELFRSPVDELAGLGHDVAVHLLHLEESFLDLLEAFFAGQGELLELSGVGDGHASHIAQVPVVAVTCLAQKFDLAEPARVLARGLHLGSFPSARWLRGLRGLRGCGREAGGCVRLPGILRKAFRAFGFVLPELIRSTLVCLSQ